MVEAKSKSRGDATIAEKVFSLARLIALPDQPYTVLRRIWRGLHWSERYGSHPGTPILVGLISLGAIAGGLVGAGLMAGVFGPIYLLGAYERGVGHEQHD